MATKPNRLLMNARPDLYAELHIQRNLLAGIDTSLLLVSDSKKVWWQCKHDKNHFWPAVVYSRSGKTGTNCGMCANKYIVRGVNDLSTLRPDLYVELHSTLNEKNGIDTTELSTGSSTNVWWQCQDNPKHYWMATVANRSKLKSTGCGMCASKYIVPGVNDLSILRPDLYAELHPTRNKENGINTSALSMSNGKKVWWQCKDHSTHYWAATVSHRSGRNDGCPMCSGKYVIHGINDLSILRPELYAQLDFTLNEENGIDITRLSVSSTQKVWWKCLKDPNHSWESVVYSRSGKAKQNCAICASKKIIIGMNDLSTLRPDLYKELHPTLNKDNGIDTTKLSVASHKKVWWQCKQNTSHFWQATIANRSSKREDGCSMCANQYIVRGVNDLSTLMPDLYAELHSALNKEKGIDTTELSIGSTKKVWWQCKKNSTHYWMTSPGKRIIKNSGCSMCVNQYVVRGINDLSILDPDLYAELHPTLNKNNGIDTTELSIGSTKKVWWQCKKNSTHYWMTGVDGRSGNRSCPMCVNKYVVRGVNDLSTLFPDLYAELHPTLNKENGIDTTELSIGSNTKVWWQCKDNPKHNWKSPINSRTGSRKSGCLMCCNKLIVHGINDLSVLRPDLYIELSKAKNKEEFIDTELLSIGTPKKVWWQCTKNKSHIWKASVNKRSGMGRGCPHCVTYRNESDFRHLFSTLTTLSFENGHVAGERELFKRDKIQIDMINHENKVIIEYDGWFSHGGNALYKTTAEDCLAKDIDTTATLLREGYRVIRIRETPLKYITTEHPNLIQVHYKDRDDKLSVINKCVRALQKMGVDIEIGNP